MFSELESLTEICGLGILDTSLVEDMTKMFYACIDLKTFDVSGFATDNVNSMANMFCNCQTLTSIDVSGFDTAKVTDMSKMFSGCANLITIYASGLWSTASVSNSSQMFYRTNNIVGGNGTVKNSSYQDATYARIDAADAPGYFTYRQERSAALVIKNGTLRDIADAIREKTGGTDLLTPEQMAEAIRGIGTS
jgi:surface protein